MTDESSVPSPSDGSSLDSLAATLANDTLAGRLTLHELLVASEEALAGKDFALAIRAMQFAVKLVPGDASMRFRLGLFQQQAGHVAEAEREFRQAILCDQTCDGAYQGLIQSSISHSDFATAIGICHEQMRHCGKTPALNLQLVTLLMMADRTPEALALIEELNNASASPEIEHLRLEAELSYRAGRPDQAIRAAHRAMQARPDDIDSSLMLARYLCADRRYAMAIPLLVEALNTDPDHKEARYMLSTSQAETGAYKDALSTTLALVRMEPTTSRHWLFAATLATMLGFRDSAIQFLQRALELDPDNLEINLALANLMGAGGHFDTAIALLDKAAAIAPDSQHIVDTRLHFLAERQAVSTQVTGATSLIRPLPILSARQKARWVLAAAPGPAGFFQSLRIKGRVITGLIMRELSHRSAQSKMGIASNLIEPLLQIVFLGLVLSLFNSGRPPLGDKLFFFYATGVLPFYIFLHVINYTLNTFSDNQSLLQVPLINRLDLVVATSLCELLIGAGTTTLIFIGFNVFGLAPHTDNTVEAIYAYGATFLFAAGIGLITATLNNLNKVVERAWQSFQRLLYVASGVFYLPQSMPVWVRDILAWNPLLHCIEWFRTGFFPQYEPPWLDKGFVLGSAMALIVVGLMLQSALRNRMGAI